MSPLEGVHEYSYEAPPTGNSKLSWNYYVTTFALVLIRWVCFCHVPVFCESLLKMDATLIFGRTFLSSVFLVMRRQLMERFTAEQEKMLPDKRTLVITHYPPPQ